MNDQPTLFDAWELRTSSGRRVYVNVATDSELCADPATQDEVLEAVAEMLLSNLEAWDRTNGDHRERTPARFVQALKQLTEREEFNFTTFDNNGIDEMVIVDNIGYTAVCAHHVLPFFGKAHIAYVPDGRIAGLSKFPRAVKYFAKGLWVQEELTQEIADFLEAKLEPKGLAIIMTGRHMCMELRGVMAEGSYTTTSAMRGVFADHSRTAKSEFLSFVHANGRHR